MRRAELVLGGVVAAMLAFVGAQIVSQRRTPPAQTRSAPPEYEPAGGPGVTVVTDNVLRGDDVRNLLELNRANTYMDALLDQRDSTVRRWPLRTARPIRVWIADAERTRGGRVGGARYVRQAFDEWTMVGIPMKFEMVMDSSRADVTVLWRESLPGKRVGVAEVHGLNDFYTRGTILLATHRPNGELLRPEHIASTVLHEVGHLLGLPHASDTASVMYPEMNDEIRTRHVHESDRVTLQLLYKLPVGRVKP